MTTTRLTAAVAEAVVAALPTDRRRDRAVARCLVDTVGVALAGADHPAVRAAAALADAVPDGVVSWPDGRRLRRRDAALVNATAAHALDYDDVLDRLTGHPSAVILPALLAIAEGPSEVDLGRLAEAYDVALQVTAALAAGLEIREHYAAGYHSSSTVGVVAAAAGAARLRGLTAAQASSAVGFAASAASGLRQNFGSDAKPLHLGVAASAAVQAVELAAAGATADPEILEGPTGYLAVLGGSPDAAAALDVLAGPSVLLTEGVNVKRFPCCYEAQRAAEAALALSGRIDPDQIAELRLTVHPGGTRPLVRPDARTGQDGRFSAPYVIAAALLDGRLEMDSFTDEAVLRPPVRRLMERTVVEEAAHPPVGARDWSDGFAVLSARLVDGTGPAVRIDAPAGHASRPLDDQQLAEKVLSCLRYSRSADATELWELLDAVGCADGPARLLTGLAALSRVTLAG